MASPSSIIYNNINWYAIPTPSSVDSRTIFIDPSLSSVGTPVSPKGGATGSYVGIGINTNQWKSDFALGNCENITYRIICSNANPNSEASSFSGFAFIGYWQSSVRPNSSASAISFRGSVPDDLMYCSHVDVTIYKYSQDSFRVDFQAYTYDASSSIGLGGTSGTFYFS
jgi:hypothetical protein